MDDSDNDDDDLDDLYGETTIVVRVPDCHSDEEDTNHKSPSDSSDEDVSPPQQQTPVRRRHPKKILTSNRLVNSINSCLNRSNFNEVTLPQNAVGNNEEETLTGFLGSKSKNNTPEIHWTTTPPSTTGRQRSCDVIKSGVSTVRYGNIGTDIRNAFNTLKAAVAQWLRASNIFRRTYFDNCVSQHLSGAGSSPADSVGRDLNLQKPNYQYLTTSVVVVLVVR